MNPPNVLNQIENFNPFAGPKIEKVIHTTSSQSEIWIACKLGGSDANRAYNESVSLILKGDLRREALGYALQTLVQRHESLRAVFSTDGSYMSILETSPIQFNVQDVSLSTASKKRETIAEYLSKDAHHVFDLVRGPLIKVGLIKTNELEHQLVITAHHIICDGWSIGILLQELGSLYSAKVQNMTAALPQPESFVVFSDEQKEFLKSDNYKKTEEFWLQQYKSSVPQLNLPTDFPRPQLRTYKSERLDFSVDPTLITELKKTGVKAGSSFVATLMAAFELFLYRQTGKNDLVVGLPAAGQALCGKTHLLGHCVNLLPLRSKINVNISFVEYLKIRKSELFDAYEHQQFSFGQLLQKLAIARDPSRVPLVPVVFNIDLGMTNDVAFTDLTYKLKSNPRACETFEIFLNATGTEDEFVLEWSYNTSLFKAETIKQMMVDFESILIKIIEKPGDSISNMVRADYLAYHELNKTNSSYPNLPLHEILRKQAQLVQKKQAIKFGETTISYKDLEEQVNQLAHQLIEKGVKPADFVGVSLPRSIELVIVLMAIMRCGAAYLPMDPNYPRKRLEFMLKDSEAHFLITTKALSLSLNSYSTLFAVEDLFTNLSKHPKTPTNIKVENTEIAYLLYTSGSTGNPKGVTISHKNLVNFLYSMAREPGISESDKLLSITTISFDIAGLELFLPLIKGATLVLADDETVKDTRLMLDVLQNENITMLQATPSTWQMLIDSGWEKPLALKALCGGEALPMALAKKILKQVNELWNVYGPTETTIWSATKQIKATDELIAIGHPIANTQLYVINEQGVLMPPGTIGELCIAGDGLANGYWKRPDLTAKKFITNVFDSTGNARLYRTGDLARLLPTGEVECLGRIDQQVKIRGHRIELGEIENALDALETVQASVVLLNADRLVANVVLNEESEEPKDKFSAWKKALAEQLPFHMVPQEFNLLNEFPKTLNGKIDRKELLESLSTKNVSITTTAPRNKTEEIVAAIWQESLGIDSIDIHSDFFELGGHSLIAVKVMALIEKQTGNRLPLSTLFEYSSIEKLATYIDKGNQQSHWHSLVPIKPNGDKTPLYIVHGGEFNVLIFHGLAKKIDKDRPVYGLQAKGLNGIDEPHATVEEMVEDYVSEIISANPNGPYALAGYSFGGVIAFEMARKLKAMGKKVTTVALFDTYMYPGFYYTGTLKRILIAIVFGFMHPFYIMYLLFNRAKFFTGKINKRNIIKIKNKVFGISLKKNNEKEKQSLIPINIKIPSNKWPSRLGKMHRVAMRRYRTTPQDIEVDLFKTIVNDVFFAHDKKYLGWKKVALKGVRRHLTPGNHLNMLIHPHDKELATSLNHVLDTNDKKN
ncbi:non-ribosomal peptide synthetase [Hwangdonia lutea]|uniref:Amino acid adenylation domain-containing protein n=1 Tax=Hwangdonia lutea TaxID=3075823 RepID=A0AA97HS50_9FLAO|nr:amino acid adenylation domain-containing protein [Hwangdonia sp. SCSIO 19198]WOD44518.1 amino acid adenylation domain-containing protein [Hwangdonia sp. SCSIO 19198]